MSLRGIVEQSIYNGSKNNCAKLDTENENGARIKSNFGAKTYKSILLGKGKQATMNQTAVIKSLIKFDKKTNRTSTVLKLNKHQRSRKGINIMRWIEQIYPLI